MMSGAAGPPVVAVVRRLVTSDLIPFFSSGTCIACMAMHGGRADAQKRKQHISPWSTNDRNNTQLPSFSSCFDSAVYLLDGSPIAHP